MTKPWPTPTPPWEDRNPSPHPGDESTDGAKLPPTPNEQPMPAIDGED